MRRPTWPDTKDTHIISLVITIIVTKKVKNIKQSTITSFSVKGAIMMQRLVKVVTVLLEIMRLILSAKTLTIVIMIMMIIIQEVYIYDICIPHYLRVIVVE